MTYSDLVEDRDDCALGALAATYASMGLRPIAGGAPTGSEAADTDLKVEFDADGFVWAYAYTDAGITALEGRAIARLTEYELVKLSRDHALSVNPRTVPHADITARSLALFLAYAKDAGNWSGTPLVGGNVESGPEERGNLTQLKRAGLITTHVDEGNAWIRFTPAGKALALAHGIWAIG